MPKIMLDSGHYGKYNKSPANPSYYESEMAWKLTNLLKAELETYQNIEVGLTRTDINKDMDVYTRGTKAKGYDMFLSNHSNAVGSNRNDNVDYPVIYRLNADTGAGNIFAQNLADGIATTMGTTQSGRVSTRLLASGDEYYGVLRGAKAVGCKYAYIVEHSFHTAYKPATWLLQEDNLKKLAIMEASKIAQFYNVQKKKENATMKIPYEGGQFRVTSIYGNRVLNGSTDWHPGLDLVGESSKNLLALCNGTIVQSRMITDKSNLTWQWGNYVMIQEDGTGNYIIYAHLSKRLVNKGDRVKVGDIIGVEGNTGYSFGSHCHLEVRNSSNKVTNIVNTPMYTGIPNAVGQVKIEIENNEEDEPMTAAEKKDFEALQTKATNLENKVAELEKELDSVNKKYKYWKDLPDWAIRPMYAAYKAGLFAGASSSNLDVNMNNIKTVVQIARLAKLMGKIDFVEGDGKSKKDILKELGIN